MNEVVSVFNLYERGLDVENYQFNLHLSITIAQLLIDKTDKETNVIDTYEGLVINDKNALATVLHDIYNVKVTTNTDYFDICMTEVSYAFLQKNFDIHNINILSENDDIKTIDCGFVDNPSEILNK